MRLKMLKFAAVFINAASLAHAAPPDAAAIRAMAETQHEPAIALFREFLALPNDANHPDDIEALNAWMIPQFEARGFTVSRIETGGADALLAAFDAGADKTALIYLQADGQPVDPAKWDQSSPWEATLKTQNAAGEWETIGWPETGTPDRDARIFARSASDSKGPMTQFLAAMDALNTASVKPAYNLKVIIDTEEELGSPHLPAAVEENRDALAADFLLIFDGPPHASNAPTVVFGARGITTVTLTAYGPKAPQHSGHYGNFVPNPALSLAQLLASMKDDKGRVRIKGFYDGVKIDKAARAQLEAVPDDEAAILASMGLAASDDVAPSLQEAIQYPSLNIRGLEAGWVGAEVRTIIPATAIAEIDIRTVKESDPERLVALLREHIENEGWLVTAAAPTDAERAAHRRIVSMSHKVSYGAFRSDPDALPGLIARGGLARLNGEEPILIRTFGGSIPIAPFVETLGLPAAIAPTVNIDNNQHSPNENIRVGNFLDGIASLAAVLTEPAP